MQSLRWLKAVRITGKVIELRNAVRHKSRLLGKKKDFMKMDAEEQVKPCIDGTRLDRTTVGTKFVGNERDMDDQDEEDNGEEWCLPIMA